MMLKETVYPYNGVLLMYILNGDYMVVCEVSHNKAVKTKPLGFISPSSCGEAAIEITKLVVWLIGMSRQCHKEKEAYAQKRRN